MDLIKRPKKVERSQKNYLTNEKYQDYAENQFKTIYEYLDGVNGEVGSKITEGEIIYDNFNNISTTITLSESVADYEDIEIGYKALRENKTIIGSQRLYNANNKYFNLHALFREGTMVMGCTALYLISNKTISLVAGANYEFSNGSGMGANQSNSFYITKVIGIKRKE